MPRGKMVILPKM
ncbi:hypothetical protein F383_37432 [Gossypium arboreum]|uniref:Uncharacterized protein n=1 Tax=Gossypium arboreum TaxID=29729 RepID=A0A0B0MF71_GOSAR|nr:hypothetical protein F383_37432 [Gossypium arboreum]